MKRTLNHGISSYSSLRKLLMAVYITSLLSAINLPFVIALSGPELSGNSKSNLFSGDEYQQIVVTGTVTDQSTRTPMPGVNIVVRGTTIGVLSDIKGQYSITIPDKSAVLVFSFVGYNTLEQPYSGVTTMNIALEPVT